jgi:hypothetical protein
MNDDDSTSASFSSSTFTWFPKLPIEIRDIIWDIASSEARVIKAIVSGIEYINETKTTTPEISINSALKRPSPLLSTSNEAHAAYIRNNSHTIPSGQKGKIQFNGNRDMVFFSNYANTNYSIAEALLRTTMTPGNLNARWLLDIKFVGTDIHFLTLARGVLRERIETRARSGKCKYLSKDVTFVSI